MLVIYQESEYIVHSDV